VTVPKRFVSCWILMEIMPRVNEGGGKIWPLAKLKGINLPRAAGTVCFRRSRLSRFRDPPCPTRRKETRHHPPRPRKRALHPRPEIKRRVRSIAQELKATYGDGEFAIVSLINGAIMSAADLMRQIDNPVRLDCIRISSYGEKTKSVGTPQVVARPHSTISATATCSSSTISSTPVKP